jgi:hypothetical protein
MILTPHVIVGVAIATTIHNPYIAVPTALALHFAGDLIPHWDYARESDDGTINKYYPLKIMADMSLGIGIGMFFTMYALFAMNNPVLAGNVFLCGIFSVLPDVLIAPVIFNSDVKGFSKFVFKIQTFLHFHAPLPWGLISQIFVSAACLLLILNSIKLL